MSSDHMADAYIVIPNYDGVGYVRISRNKLIELCNQYLHTNMDQKELCPHGYEDWDNCPKCKH